MLLPARASTAPWTFSRCGLFCAALASLLLLEATPVGARPYALRYTDTGFALDAVHGNTQIPQIASIRYEADTAHGLAFRTVGIESRHAIGPDTQIDFRLEGPSASQAAVSVRIKPQAGSVRTVWTIHVSSPDLSLDAGKSGFQLEYASPILDAETVPSIRFVRPTGRLPYEVVGDTPYRDLEWQLREVTMADSRLVIATDWYDPDWIYGHQSARAANLSAGFSKDSPTQATYVLAFVPLPAGPTDVRSPACASDVAAAAAGRPLSLTALCNRPGHLFAPGEDVRFTLRTHNVTSAAAQG
nr:hypothetical protein [Armatimonadota bacterium]